MSEVRWLPESLEDLQRLYEFLSEKNRDAAARAAQAILNGAELLRRVPEAGRPMSDSAGQRELFITFGAGAYVLRYRIDSLGVVVIVRVWHSRENRRG